MAQTSRLVIELDSRDAEAKAADTRKALEALEGAGLSIQPALNKAGAGMESMGKSADKATKSVANERDELEALLGQIDPVTRRLGELDKQEQALAKHRKDGKLDTETYNEYQAKITQTRNSLTGFSAETGKATTAIVKNDRAMAANGQTLKQYNANLRGVPAQFTDIATSLQGGQAPLTVFLQQGGQLKDMFGGAGPAAKALGGYVLGLINPFTVAAAAVGVLALAYNKGSSEQTAFNTSLTLTGNTAGTSSDQLGAMAERVSAVSGTISGAAAVLAQLAGSTRIPAQAFEMIATAAVKFEAATGQAVSTTVSNFETLAKDPLAASIKLNESLNYLTVSTYSQIKALEDQGNKQAAATVAEQAYANALTVRSAKIREDLGYVESAWRIVGEVAKGAWDAMAGVGRASPLETQIKAAQTLVDNLAAAKASALPGTPSNTIREEQAQKDLTDLMVRYEEKKRRDASAGVAAQQVRGLTSAAVAIDKVHEGFASNAEKMAKERLSYEKEISTLQAGVKTGKVSADDPRLGAERIAKDLDNIDKKYADAKAPKAKAYTEDAGMKMLDAARQTNAVLVQQNASINGQGIATEKLGAQAQALVKWEQQLANIKGKQTLTADQKSLLASQDLITAQLKKNAALEREADIQKGIKQANEDQVKLLTATGQLREANQMKSGLDDAAQMAEYERQGNTEAAKRLETLIKIRDINLNAAQKPGTIEGVSKAPTATGLDPSVGGADSEITRLNAETVRLDQWRATELEKQQAYLDLKAINEETYAQRIANINNQAAESRAGIEKAKNTAILNQSSSFFGIMATLSQSGHSKLAAIGKAAAMAQATIDGYLAIQKALAAFPPPFNFIAAGVVGVATAANVAAIAGIGFSDGGYTGPGGVNDPAGTVHKGEIVWSQADIRKFGGVASVEALRNGNASALRAPSGGSTSTGNSSESSSSGGDSTVSVGNASQVTITVYVDAKDGGGSMPDPARLAEAIKVVARQEIANARRNGGALS